MSENLSFSDLKQMERVSRRQFIIDAAVRMFIERPFSQVTMRGIAEAVGVTPAAIYSYFPDKNDLFAEAYIAAGEPFIQGAAELMRKCETFCIEDVAVHYISHFFGSRNGRPFNFILQFTLDETIPSTAWEKINSANRRFTELIERFFQRFNENPDAAPKIHAQSFIAALNGILLTSKNYPGKTEKEILSHMREHAVVIAGMFREKLMA
jgi:AcrR family transcriptional regulator